jgi:predicted AAA+ superfamily ATPase
MAAFFRANETQLQDWYRTPSRKPLLLRGARQVGKSTLVRQFAARQGLELLEVNLERNLGLEQVFKSLKMDRILLELEGILGQKVSGSNKLLFLDEIQATPHALAALRYFYEDCPEIPLIAAGSLLEFVLGQGLISMPVGRIQYHYLGPVTFDEYIQARKEDFSFSQLKGIHLGVPLAEASHLRLDHLQREYLFIGGMPQSVQAFLARGLMDDCEAVLQSILDTYRDDFHKYASQVETLRLQRIFDRVAGYLNRKVKYAALDPGEQSRETKKMLQLLTQAKLISPIYHTHANGVPLGAEADLSVYKLLFLDVGLVNRMLQLSWREIRNLDERGLIHEGPLAEQYIGQSLLAAFSNFGMMEPKLHYWLREGKSANAEVDFVVAQGQHVIPIEVKSGKSGSMKSLLQFVAEKKSPVAVRFDLNPPSIQRLAHQVGSERVQFDLISLPLYAVGELPRLLQEYFSRSDS